MTDRYICPDWTLRERGMDYMEKDCIITFKNQQFTAGGAIVTNDFIMAYPADNNILNTWHGDPIGTWRPVASWPIRSWMGSTMYQIEATVDGIVYTGRGFGVGMWYKGKRKVGKRS